MTNTKPIPKSLHTITVLVRLARFERDQDRQRGIHTRTSADHVDAALAFLGYAYTPDIHGLGAKAIKALEQGA